MISFWQVSNILMRQRKRKMTSRTQSSNQKRRWLLISRLFQKEEEAIRVTETVSTHLIRLHLGTAGI